MCVTPRSQLRLWEREAVTHWENGEGTPPHVVGKVKERQAPGELRPLSHRSVRYTVPGKMCRNHTCQTNTPPTPGFCIRLLPLLPAGLAAPADLFTLCVSERRGRVEEELAWFHVLCACEIHA